MLAALLPFLIFSAFALTPTLVSADEGINDDADDPIEPTDPLPPEAGFDPTAPTDPVDPATLGATFDATEDGIDIQFGENETGRLAVITYVDTEDAAENVLETHEARYYLVPEGVEWPDNTNETSGQIPGEGDGSAYLLEDFEDRFGLTLLGTHDLLADGDVTPTNRDMADSLPPLTTNADVDYYYLEAATDGDELAIFLQEGWVETRDDQPAATATEETVGTDDTDVLAAMTPEPTLDGAGGDDILGADAPNVTVQAGASDDPMEAVSGVIIDGGPGNDAINSASQAQINSGDENDQIIAIDGDITNGPAEDAIELSGSGGNLSESVGLNLDTFDTSTAVLFGGNGDGGNTLSAETSNATPTQAPLFGGTGIDALDVRTGAIAFDEDGDDVFETDSGGTVAASDDDESQRIRETVGAFASAATVVGGAVAEIYDVDILNNIDREDPVFTVITDFDSDEDLLVFKSDKFDIDVEKFELREDKDGAFTDVIVLFENLGNALGQASAIIRLMGVTGLSLDQILEL